MVTGSQQKLSVGQCNNMTIEGESVINTLPNRSEGRLDSGESMSIDVVYGDATTNHSLTVEGQAPDDQESSTSNLKLSVGYAESDDDLDYEGTLNDQLRSWRMHSGPSASQFENDFDYEMPAEKIKALITGEEYFFKKEADGDFVEEVFSQKEPKIYHGYLFGDVIGEGSYAKVKEVVEYDSLVRRAIKIVKHNRIRKIPNGVENVQREIKILRKLKHKHVISLIETFRNEEKGKLYMVFELCMGSLQQHIDGSPKGCLVEYEAHLYYHQLISGLEYIHSKGIIHKDIKPGNLLLGPDLALKISDFGVAEELPLFQPDDTCSIVQGTPKFQAPELISGNTETFRGFKSDIWSTGVTLYNMISGAYPFEGEAIMKLFDNIARQPLIMPQNIEISTFLVDLLNGILHKDPVQRLSIEDIKHSEWYNRHFDDQEVSEYLVSRQKVYRPLTVGCSLEMMFGADVGEDGLPILNPGVARPDPQYRYPQRRIEEDGIPPVFEPPRKRVQPRRRVFNCFAPSRSP